MPVAEDYLTIVLIVTKSVLKTSPSPQVAEELLIWFSLFLPLSQALEVRRRGWSNREIKTSFVCFSSFFFFLLSFSLNIIWLGVGWHWEKQLVFLWSSRVLIHCSAGDTLTCDGTGLLNCSFYVSVKHVYCVGGSKRSFVSMKVFKCSCSTWLIRLGRWGCTNETRKKMGFI